MKVGRKPQFAPKQVERIRYMRDEGLTCRDIARVMGTSPQTISRYLSAKKDPA